MKQVGIFIYPNAEVLDFSGPFEVFSTVNRVAKCPEFNATLIAETADTVVARAGFSVVPMATIDSHPPLDILVVVGGYHADDYQKANVLDWIVRQSKTVSCTASVCTGAFFLAEAGLLDGKTVTSHWEDIDELRRDYPKLHVVDDVRWVDEGDIVTSAGISAGIDMSLHLVERFASENGGDVAQKTARQMDYHWQK